MRILQLFHSYLKTTENWSYNLINRLADVEILVGAKRFEKCNFYPPRFKYLEFPLRPVEYGRETFWTRRYNKLVRSLLRHFYPGFLARSVGKIDLMHSHFSFVGWEYRTLARRLDVPHVVSFYGFDYEWIPHNQPKWRERYQRLFSEADLFLCEGEHGARILEQSGCPAAKIRVARLGVTVEEIGFCPRAKAPGELKLLQVASLSVKKGHRYTIEGFLKALQTVPNLSLTIVGGDSEGLKKELVGLIDPPLLGTKIRFIDQIDFSLLHDFMRDYHVFIHPSCYSEERDCEGGAPVVLLDAQATGMPVISTTHCDIPSVVVDGSTGLLAPERDGAAIAELIVRFARMGQEEYDRFAAASRRHVEDEYDVTRNAQRLKEIYRELLQENGRTAG